MTKHPFLEVTYRQGKPLAAYLYLPRESGDKSCRTVKLDCGLLIDYAADGRAIGIEIASPASVTLTNINEALASVNQAPLTPKDLTPLQAA